jgi:hypothetical protein
MKVNVGNGNPNYAGYIYVSNGNVFYKNTAQNTEASMIIKSADYSNAKVICAIGPYVYFSTASGIYKVSVVSNEVETIVKDLTISTEVAGYTVKTLDGEVVGVEDIYFFAKRIHSEDAEDKSDEKVYMYRVSANGSDATVVGKFA